MVKRRLTPEQIRLGYLLTAKEPIIRVQVIDFLHKVIDLKDPALWLTR